MPLPVLRTDRAEAANLKNKTKHCTFVLPGDYLSTNITKRDVKVTHDGRTVTVQSAKAVQNSAGKWFLIVRTKDIVRRVFGDSEEIEVTVTNPDTGDTSDPPTEVEVVYYDEEPIPPGPLKPRATTRGKAKTAKSAARGTRFAAKSKGKKSKGTSAKATKKKKK